ncbi:MAG: adenylate kinase [Candidatus Omnitrophota bacterium]
MRVVLLGPPGAGKGTLAAAIKEKFGMLHLSTGDILRAEMKSGSSLGNEMKSFVDKGELVPDEVVTRIIANKLRNSDLSKGVLFDGYPRTVQQAQDLDKILSDLDAPIDVVVFMEVDLPVIIKRLTGRRVCRQCGAVYHTVNIPSKKEGICDLCQGELYQRADDKEETIRNRMDVYLTSTAPIINYYQKQEKLRKVDASQDVKDVLVFFEGLIKSNE